MNRTKIQYLTHTCNPLAMRCSRVSEGCRNCWHLRMCDRLAGNPQISAKERAAYRGGRPVLRAMLRPRKPAIVGLQFMGDLFHESVPDEMIQEIWATMALSTMTTGSTFVVLTKRPERMAKMSETWIAPKKIILGVSVEDQESADERIPWLLRTRAAVRVVSYEPALGPVNFNLIPLNHEQCESRDACEYRRLNQCGMPHWEKHPCVGWPAIDWIVAGGETGPGARLADPQWFRDVRDQCQSMGVPLFFKQHSDAMWWGPRHGEWHKTRARNRRLLDGREWNEVPQ